MDARDPLADVLARHAGRSHVSRLLGTKSGAPPARDTPFPQPGCVPAHTGNPRLLNTRRLAVKEVVHHHYILLAGIVRSRNSIAARDAHVRNTCVSKHDAEERQTAIAR